MRQAIAIGCAVAMCAIGVAAHSIVGPQIVGGNTSYGRTLTWPAQLSETEMAATQRALALPTFLRSITEACPKDKVLLNRWTAANTSFVLWRGLDGTAFLNYEGPSHTVRSSSVRDLSWRYDEAAVTGFETDIELRRHRIEEAVLVRLGEILGEAQGHGKLGSPVTR
jgi:hypothetical protein